MKKVTFFKSAILALLACVCFVSCENNSGEIPTEPETYTVKLGWAGEILDVSYEPLSTRVTTDDLYGIQVYSNDDSEWIPYAYGLFDDPNNITVTLQKDCKYKFVATMVNLAQGGGSVTQSNADQMIQTANAIYAKYGEMQIGASNQPTVTILSI